MSIANDMFVGIQCSWCGIRFTDEHGYPIICKGCFEDYRQKLKVREETAKLALLKKYGLQLAILDEL